MEQNTNVVKPRVQLIGNDSNVFNLIGLVSRALRKAGQPEKAKEMTERAFKSGSYDAVLAMFSEYVEIE